MSAVVVTSRIDMAQTARSPSISEILRAARWPRGAIAGVVLMIGTIVVHGIRTNLMGGDGPPEVAFFLGISACLVVNAFTLNAFYGAVRPALGGHWLRRGATFAALVWGSVWFGNFLGALGRDYDGGADMFTPYKIEQYATFIADSFNLLGGCLCLALLARKDVADTSPGSPSSSIVVHALIGLVALPAVIFGWSKVVSLGFGPGYSIPDDALAWHDVAIAAPLFMSGLFVPVVHRAWASLYGAGGVRFAAAFVALVWLPNALFLLPLGYGVQALLYFSVVVGAPLFAWAALCARSSA